jgi:MFS family permease
MTAADAPRIFFGWRVVATAFTVAFFAFGTSYYGPSVFLHTLHEQRGWPITTISAAITVHFLLSAAIVTRLSEVHQRFGIAFVTRVGILATVSGLVGWGLAQAPWQLFLAALLTGAGWAATSGAAITAMVSPWFERRRPLALGHALNGASVGGIVLTPVWVLLIDRFSLAGAVTLLGAVMIATLWPLTGRYLRPTPETEGLAPDGDQAGTAADPAPAAGTPTGVRALLLDRSFMTLSGAFALGLFASTGLVAHLVTRLAPSVGEGRAAAALSLATACAVVGRLVFGRFIGGANRRRVAAGSFVMQSCGAILLGFGSTTAPVIAGCVLFGLGIGNLLLLPPLIAQAEFNRSDVPRVVALVTAINQAVFAFAPGVFGGLRDLTGDYVLPFVVVAITQLAASALVLCGLRRIT